jgi:hypothetical protein
MRHAEGLDQAVRRARLDDQIGAQSLRSLPMQGIHLQTLASRDFGEQTSGLQQNFVCGSVLLVEAQGLVVAVVEVARHLVYPLPKRAAIGDIHFLETAADRKHRQAGGDRARNQRKRRSIPIWVM